MHANGKEAAVNLRNHKRYLRAFTQQTDWQTDGREDGQTNEQMVLHIRTNTANKKNKNNVYITDGQPVSVTI